MGEYIDVHEQGTVTSGIPDFATVLIVGAGDYFHRLFDRPFGDTF